MSDDCNDVFVHEVPTTYDHEAIEVIETDPFENVVTEEIVLLDTMLFDLSDVEML